MSSAVPTIALARSRPWPPRTRTLTGLLAATATALLAFGTGALADDVTTKFSAHAAGSTATVDHSAWGRLLATYVKPTPHGLNQVDYKAFKASGQRELKDYVARLEASDPAKLDRPEQFAFWANLYNAKTIDIVLDHYPVGSIREIEIGGGLFGLIKKSVGAGGPWKAQVLKVSGAPLSLDDIEHKILRPVFKDPRVHYSVNCASRGCPNLGTEAFTGATIDAQLDAGARAFVNHPRGIAVTGDSITASSIYDWFQSDFGGSAAGVLEHVRKYAAPELAQRLSGLSSIASYDYDWKLNDIAR
ncbi:MAG: DUF547 domain-containing protein [Hyphomicrobiaceae bacterium]|nr:DUF547 domain-containing protein [Hyphomicrobiaceae bacterium]